MGSWLGVVLLAVAVLGTACGATPETPSAAVPAAASTAAPEDTVASPGDAAATQPRQVTDSTGAMDTTTLDPTGEPTQSVAVAPGQAVQTTVDAPSGDWEAISFADGSFSLDGDMVTGEHVQVAYNSGTGQGIMVVESEGRDTVVVRRVGNPPTSWLDSVHAVREDVLLSNTASFIAAVGDTAALEGGDPSVRIRGTMHDDVAVLRSLTVEDSESGRVIQSWESTAPIDYVGLGVEQLIGALDDPNADTVDYGFRPATLAELDGKLSYDVPDLPAALPGGFELSTVFYANKSSVSPSGANPDSEEVIVATYRRAYDHITVTFRTARPSTWDQANEKIPDPVWSDPYGDLHGPAKYKLALGVESVFTDARVGVGIPLHVWYVADNRVTIIETSADVATLADAAVTLTVTLTGN